MKKQLTCAIVLSLSLSMAIPAVADSLFTQQAAAGGTLVAEKKTRFAPGDIVSVLVREKIDASTAADTNTKKESDVSTVANEAANKFLTTDGRDGGLNIMDTEELPNWGGQTENESKNRGQTTRESTLTTTVSCFVKQVFPNGTMLIEGERKVTINREDSTLFISGVVRSKDVTPDNTIPSTLIANAQIQLRGKGELWNNQRRGFLTKVVDWVNPF